MRSPPSSPSQGLQGASRIIGGMTRGHARGNVFNFADGPDVFFDEVDVKPKAGKVLLYTSMGDPETMKPAMSLKHEVSPTLAPVLAKLAKRYTRINSAFFNKYFGIWLTYILESNACVWVYEDGTWDLKGPYESAMEEDEEVVWQFKGDMHVLLVLVVRS